MVEVETTATINGERLYAVLATVESTHIGLEDHGFYSWTIQFGGNSWGQGLGHRFFNESALKLITSILDVIRASWENLKGKQVFLLYREKYSDIVGLLSLDGERFIFLV